MTIALCFACGEKKSNSLKRCEHCKRQPINLDELATSFLLSDRFYSENQLEEYGARIKDGLGISAPERFRNEFLDGLEAQEEMESSPPFRLFGYAHAWRVPSFFWALFTQRRREQVARTAIERLRAGQRFDFCLYLRPFWLDRVIFLKPVERRLSWLVERRMPLLSFAGKKSPLGSARITIGDERWQEDFLLLARNAVAIFVHDPRDMRSEDFMFRIDEFEGLKFEFNTLATLGLTNRVIFLLQGGQFDFGNNPFPDHWAIPSKRNFCELLSSGIGLRPLNARSIREIIETFTEYREIEPPMRDGFGAIFCLGFIDMWNNPDSRIGEAKKRICEGEEYWNSSQGQSHRRSVQFKRWVFFSIMIAVWILTIVWPKHC